MRWFFLVYIAVMEADGPRSVPFEHGPYATKAECQREAHKQNGGPWVCKRR